ncbi:hypothetical protein METBIDRAFT_101393 [Metschnikowia bicuspidata var. bicuspidata NRRL YB-4993]|uniref:Uncharacterized protein n=1 Tax=Metschnikowia bicuspidata var. bicuspidata NRRL YB-4993 TaxID=869754 RepID=A0A1A0HH20_9ASCO|nr:hypothetical protein METBIDRAFT_101393 [Metschnikowia bicuspidata var. bicuspidata NRRL YB-4993]OBA23172.1 hypothetical protein METBIDRAFT_101393 [Metschnikowia bicuspidata var. bicuspidata NRRL YB-4993]
MRKENMRNGGGGDDFPQAECLPCLGHLLGENMTDFSPSIETIHIRWGLTSLERIKPYGPSLCQTAFTSPSSLHFTKQPSLYQTAFTLPNGLYYIKRPSLYQTAFTLPNSLHFTKRPFDQTSLVRKDHARVQAIEICPATVHISGRHRRTVEGITAVEVAVVLSDQHTLGISRRLQG